MDNDKLIYLRRVAEKRHKISETLRMLETEIMQAKTVGALDACL